MKRVYLGLGSNLGDRAANIEDALRRLGESQRLKVLRRSSLYESAPMYVARQPWFLNMVAEVETTLFPMMLLNHVLGVERAMGRRRTIDKGPRDIDVDILLYGGIVVQSAKLSIPHPRMQERRFVMEPMVELAPDLRHPVLGKGMLELFTAVKDQTVRKLGAT
jgi:2-amino-4-hydroxy-6-hydroxymethyldihydropteridine diphosphokinase